MGILGDMRVPVFKAGGVPEKTDDWQLEVSGLVEDPLTLTLDELKSLPQSDIDARLTSVSGFSYRCLWQGVLWRNFLSAIKPLAEANHATFISHGKGYTTTVSFKDLDHPRVLLVHGVGGEPLELDYGGPLRMMIPNLWGYKSAKWLAAIELTDSMKGGYWEDRGYPREGIIKPGNTLDINSGERRPISGGEVTEF